MAKISRTEAKVLLKDHEKWTNYSWIDDICEYAISDMERVEVLEKENAALKQKLEKIEQLVEDWNNEAVKESRAFGYILDIEQIMRE